MTMPHPTLAADTLAEAIDTAAAALEAQVIAWRRDLHEHPELGNREFRTAGLVAAHPSALGFDEVRAQFAGTVVFLFQPAEEAPPDGEDGGAKMMIAVRALAHLAFLPAEPFTDFCNETTQAGSMR